MRWPPKWLVRLLGRRISWLLWGRRWVDSYLEGVYEHPEWDPEGENPPPSPAWFTVERNEGE